MLALLPPILTVFLVLLLAQQVYWHLVRPVILLKLRYALFEIRDRLRLMAIRKEVGCKQPAYAILEELCNLSLYAMEYAGLAVIQMAPKDTSSTLRVEKNLAIIAEAEQRLRDVFDDISRINIGIVICNSPGWFPWIIVSVLSSYWSNKARERIDRWKRGVMGMTYEAA